MPIAIKALVIQSLTTVSRVLGPVGWLFSIGMEVFSRLSASEKPAILQAQNRLLPADRQLSYQAIDDADATDADWYGRYAAYSVYAAQFAEAGDRNVVLHTTERQRLADDLYGLEIGADDFAAAVVGGADWISDTAILIESTLIARGGTPQQWAKTNADIIAYFSGEADALRSVDPAGADRMTVALRNFARDGIGTALADANVDYLEQAGVAPANAFEGRALDFAQYAGFRNALADLVGDQRYAAVRSYLELAAAEIDRGGQWPVIRTFAAKPTNPFDDASFDPEAANPLAGGIAENGAGTFVLFLPYMAAPGGQRVRVDLGGVAGEAANVMSNGNSIPVTGGAFYLTVPEGRKDVSFALIVDDLSSDVAATLSATLVDAAGNATHRTHLEANLALAYDEDIFEAVFDASTSANFQAVDRITGRFDQNDPTSARTQLF
jgi:hypothetical protein